MRGVVRRSTLCLPALTAPPVQFDRVLDNLLDSYWAAVTQLPPLPPPPPPTAPAPTPPPVQRVESHQIPR
jgi:hypothetical protein